MANMTHVISFLVGVVLGLYLVGDFNVNVAYKKQSVVYTGGAYSDKGYSSYDYSDYTSE
jgi:hypothetical protein